jgi:hypothetical protein
LRHAGNRARRGKGGRTRRLTRRHRFSVRGSYAVNLMSAISQKRTSQPGPFKPLFQDPKAPNPLETSGSHLGGSPPYNSNCANSYSHQNLRLGCNLAM